MKLCNKIVNRRVELKIKAANKSYKLSGGYPMRKNRKIIFVIVIGFAIKTLKHLLARCVISNFKTIDLLEAILVTIIQAKAKVIMKRDKSDLKEL